MYAVYMHRLTAASSGNRLDRARRKVMAPRGVATRSEARAGQPGRLSYGQRAFYGLMGQSKGPRVLTSTARAGKGLRGRAKGFLRVSGAVAARGAAPARIPARRKLPHRRVPPCRQHFVCLLRPSTSVPQIQAPSLGHVTEGSRVTATTSRSIML